MKLCRQANNSKVGGLKIWTWLYCYKQKKHYIEGIMLLPAMPTYYNFLYTYYHGISQGDCSLW